MPPGFGHFLSQTTAISLSNFSKIRLDNVLALTVTYTLVFVNVLTSANIYKFHFFFKLFVLFLLKLNWSRGVRSILLIILYDAQQCIDTGGNMFSFKEIFFYFHQENNEGNRNIHRMKTLVPANVCFKQTK